MKITRKEVETCTIPELGRQILQLLKHARPLTFVLSMEELILHADPPTAYAVSLFVFHNGGPDILQARGKTYIKKVEIELDEMFRRGENKCPSQTRTSSCTSQTERRGITQPTTKRPIDTCAAHDSSIAQNSAAFNRTR